jgi:hypothetical protein
MKKIVLIFLSLIVLNSCKNDSKTEETTNSEKIDTDSQEKTAKQRDGLTLLKGEFVYFADAAVLQTHRDVYAVVIDEKMHELDNMAKKFKNEPTDYVTVAVRGKITPKPEGEEGWPFRIAIKEIMEVTASNPESNNVVKLESK